MHFLEPLPSAVIFCCLQLFKFICDFFFGGVLRNENSLASASSAA